VYTDSTIEASVQRVYQGVGLYTTGKNRTCYTASNQARALGGNYIMAFQGDSIFWVDTDKVVPNPFQPRREFDQNKLQELSESIRMYGVLQPLTVTRSEVQNDDGTFYTKYELIAGERRLRASRLAQVAQVPVIIREGEQSEQEKLELAIIENLQREDLNAIDRALAFSQLADQFKLSHTEVAKKVQRSREYVSNSIRLLALPQHIQGALQRGELGEGHARTLLMLTDRPEEQETIFREVLLKKMSVREVERIVRKIATDKVRKKQHSDIDSHLIEFEKEFTETLGTRVQIQKTEFGGKLTIDYFSEDDLFAILTRMKDEAAVPLQTNVQAMAAVVAATPLETVVVQPPVLESVQSTPTLDELPVLEVDHTPQVASEIIPIPAPVVVSEPFLILEDPVITHSEPEPEPEPEPSVPVAVPQADPGLLAKLAAHTSFGFSRPQPTHQPDVQDVPPAPQMSQAILATAEPVVQPLPVPVEPEQPKADKVNTEDVAGSLGRELPADEADDMYSVRNFSI
jgi:ParB family chromosome partitioning protein